jgi:hypothetical protein
MKTVRQQPPRELHVRNRLALGILLILLAAAAAIWLTPSAVSNGVRFWVWWRAQKEGFTANIDQIDAPFLRPVVIHRLQLKSARDDALRVEVTATNARFTLNFKHILLHLRGRAIHTLSIGELRCEVHRANPGVRALSRRAWATLHRLLPNTLDIARLETRVENGPTLALLRNGFLSASETEPGRFGAEELLIASPWFHQTFAQLRGATHWEADRLSLAGLTLTRGLDLQSATVDLSRIGNQRVALQFELDAFNGRLRGNISHEWRSSHSTWKIAGGATDVSLAQTSEAFGFADRVDGLLHAGNFTFRGNLSEPDRVTASLWAELTALTWRNRTAEAIMLGAALYDRRIQLQQLYIKQKSNQFTLSGEALLPTNWSGWLSPDFRGTISASINELGEFAALFGGNQGDFAGKITVEGAMDTRDRKFGGHVTLQGASLTFFKTVVDNLSARLNLKAPELQIESLEIRRKNDSFSAQGKIDLSDQHDYSGVIAGSVENLPDYFFSSSLPEKQSRALPATFEATVESGRWDARGVIQTPGSSPLNFTAQFAFPLGTNWDGFRAAPLNLTLDFPSLLLANASGLFASEIFSDGILNGHIALSGTLEHPNITGEAQLLNGRLATRSRTFSNLTEASGRIVFLGNRASVEFLNLATPDAELALRGEIDFEDTNSAIVKITALSPLFSLAPPAKGCVDRIQIAPAALSLAPLLQELDFQGAIFDSRWTIALKQKSGIDAFGITDLSESARRFPLCLSAAGTDGASLVLGAPARPTPSGAKKKTRRR